MGRGHMSPEVDRIVPDDFGTCDLSTHIESGDELTESAVAWPSAHAVSTGAPPSATAVKRSVGSIVMPLSFWTCAMRLRTPTDET